MTMYVQSLGSAGAPTILFVHGGGVGGWSWEPVAERLTDYHCLLPDLPEHGRSMQEGPFSTRDAAARIAALIQEQAHGGRANLVGISLGGQVVLQVVSDAPQLVGRAVVSGVLARRLPFVLGASLPLLRAYMPFRNIDLLVRWNQRSYGYPDRYLPQFREETRNMTYEGLARILKENNSFRLPSSLKDVAVPTLVLVGERELGVTRRSAMDIVATLPNSKGRSVPGLGHNWPVQDPKLCARVLRAWIENKPLPERLKPLRKPGPR